MPSIRPAVLTAMLVASVAINVVLAHKLRQWNGLLGAPAKYSIEAGATIPPFMAVDLSGQSKKVAYNEVPRPTVLYIFTPPCAWCARNLDNFKVLLDKEGKQYRFIGLSLSKDGLTEYVAKHGLNLPVYSGLSIETQKIYKLGSTPQTIIVSPEGKVLQDWVGAYVGEQKSQVEAFFHVSLPGLRELPKAETAEEKGGSAPQAN